MLQKRLRELTSGERALQVDFLIHLSEFDRRQGYLDAGHGSLWSYCLRELHLREGPAARRIGAMRVLRQYPELEAPLRDGRLCLSTVTMIAPLLADHELSTVVSRAAYLTKAELEHLVATLRPVAAPRNGVRLITSQPATPREAAAGAESAAGTEGVVLGGAASAEPRATAGSPDAAGMPAPIVPPEASGMPAPIVPADATGMPATALRSGPEEVLPLERVAPEMSAAVEPKSERARAELRPVAAEQWSLRVTMDAAMKNDLETLESLLSHSLRGDLTSIVREALRCAVEKHGKRRGAVAPTRSRAAKPTPNRVVPAPANVAKAAFEVKRASKATKSASEVKRESNLRAEFEVKHSDRGGAPAEKNEALAERSAQPTPSAQPTLGAQPTPSEQPTLSPQPTLSAQPTPSAQPTLSAQPKLNEQPTLSPQPTLSAQPTLRAQSSPERRSAREPANAAQPPRAISAAVRREVWARDGGCCSWRGKDGRRCGSRWKLEIDHIVPAAFGGAPTAGNLRLLCRPHNFRHAENVFGREHMAKFVARSRAASSGAASRNDAGPAPGGAASRNDGGPASAEIHTPPQATTNLRWDQYAEALSGGSNTASRVSSRAPRASRRR